MNRNGKCANFGYSCTSNVFRHGVEEVRCEEKTTSKARIGAHTCALTGAISCEVREICWRFTVGLTCSATSSPLIKWTDQAQDRSV